MNDQQLTRLFRSLDEPVQPDEGFAEALFVHLEEQAQLGHRRMTTIWALLAAALLLTAAIGSALAVGSGLVKLPALMVLPSATAQASAMAPTDGPSATAVPGYPTQWMPYPGDWADKACQHTLGSSSCYLSLAHFATGHPGALVAICDYGWTDQKTQDLGFVIIERESDAEAVCSNDGASSPVRVLTTVRLPK